MASLIGTFVLVVILHAVWDTYPDWPTFVIVGGISLALLLRQTHRDVLSRHRRTRRSIRTAA